MLHNKETQPNSTEPPGNVIVISRAKLLNYYNYKHFNNKLFSQELQLPPNIV